jgi:hypothetical protein
MTFSIQQVKKTRSDKPPRTVVYGEHKIGKSTFGSCAPKPVFIQTEDGLDNIDADAFPLCKTWGEVLGWVGSLYTDPHEFKTVVLDSADWAEKLLHEHVCKENKVESIESFGYGKGYVLAAEAFDELLDGLNALRVDRGMGVVVLCHAEIKRFDDPLANSYDRYQIKLHKQVAKLLQEWSDVIGYAQLDTATRTEKKNDFKKTERAIAITTGRRVLHLSGSPAFGAGNRYSLPDVIDFSWAAYEEALKNSRNFAGQ